MTSHVLASTSGQSIPDLVVFLSGAAMILCGAVGVILWRNPVHSALSLVLTLFGVAVEFIEQQADFLAAVQIIVYAGAIVVLFLFVIMFLGVDRRDSLGPDPLAGQRMLAAVLVVASIASIVALGFEARWAVGPHHVAGATAGPSGNVSALGRSVFTTYLFAFEATSALLIIAVVGAVVLARRSGEATSDERALPDTEPRVGAGEEVGR